MSVFDRVKFLCDSNGISVSQMEKEIGISQGAAYKWKVSSPSQKMFEKLSCFFNVRIDYLMTGEENAVLELAQIDVDLSNMSHRMKEYALKMAALPQDKQEHIMSLIDMLG